MRRRILLPVACIAAAAVATWAFVFYVDPFPRAPVPPASASVMTVARAYLDAAEAEDCGLTRALTERTSGLEGWCRHPRLLSYSHLTLDPVDADSGSAIDERVVHFDMRITASGGSGFSNDMTEWGLLFHHTNDGWRVFDQGVA